MKESRVGHLVGENTESRDQNTREAADPVRAAEMATVERMTTVLEIVLVFAAYEAATTAVIMAATAVETTEESEQAAKAVKDYLVD